MSEMPKEFKIIVVQDEDLPEHELKGTILHCSTEHHLKELLEKNKLSIVFIACTNDTLHKISSLIKDYSNIDTLYILTKERDIMWPYELELQRNVPWIQINNTKQLMRHLFLKAMLCYIQQGDQHKQNGDYGLANLCFLDARKALHHTAVVV